MSRSQQIEVFPTMHDRSSINLGDPAQDSLFKFGFRFYSDVPQESVRHLAKERFNQIEPRPMFGRVDITEAVGLGRVAK